MHDSFFVANVAGSKRWAPCFGCSANFITIIIRTAGRVHYFSSLSLAGGLLLTYVSCDLHCLSFLFSTNMYDAVPTAGAKVYIS